MTSITIQCSCGQAFSFDVEPIEGRMPSVVACPTCGVDATELGNEEIQRQLTPADLPPPSEKKEILMIVGAGVAALALFALAGSGYLWWQSRTEKKPLPQVASPAPEPQTTASAPAEPVPAATNAAPAVAVALVATVSKPDESSVPITDPGPVAAAPRSKVERDPSFVGVGALFDPDTKSEHVKIVNVLANSPAKKAGLAAGDLLLSIEDKPIRDLASTEIANLFFGPIGSKVTMEVISSKTGQTNRVEIVRKKYR